MLIYDNVRRRFCNFRLRFYRFILWTSWRKRVIMPKDTRSKYEHYLNGSCTNVLNVHIMELLAKNSFHPIMGYDPSPDVQMFKRMKEIWKDVDTTWPFQTFEFKTEQKDELIMTYTEILEKHGVDGELLCVAIIVTSAAWH